MQLSPEKTRSLHNIVSCIFSTDTPLQISEEQFDTFLSIYDNGDQSTLNTIHTKLCHMFFSNQVRQYSFEKFVSSDDKNHKSMGIKFVSNLLKSEDCKHLDIIIRCFSKDNYTLIYNLIMDATATPSLQSIMYIFKYMIDTILYEKNMKKKQLQSSYLYNIAKKWNQVKGLYFCIDHVYKKIKVVHERPNVNDQMFEHIYKDDGVPKGDQDYTPEQKERHFKKMLEFHEIEEHEIKGDNPKYTQKDLEEIFSEGELIDEDYKKPFTCSNGNIWYNPYELHGPKFHEYFVFDILPVEDIKTYINDNLMANVKRILQSFVPEFSDCHLYYLFIKQNTTPSMFIENMKVITGRDYNDLLVSYFNKINKNNVDTKYVDNIDDVDKNVDELFKNIDITTKELDKYMFDHRKLYKISPGVPVKKETSDSNE